MSFCCLLAKSCLTLETPWTAARQASVFNCLWEFAQIHVHWVSDTIQRSHPPSPPSPPALNLSQHQGLFQWGSSLHQVAKVLELQLQHLSFQWILRVWSPCCPRDSWESSPALQFKSISSSALNLLYATTLISVHDYWKKHSFDYMDFIGKVIALSFNMMSRFVIAFHPRSKYLLISWLQAPSTVILEPKKIKSATVSIFPHLFAMKWWDQMPWSWLCFEASFFAFLFQFHQEAL